MNLTNYKCNEQRTLDTSKRDFWKEGRKYDIRKKWCVEVNMKEMEWLSQKMIEENIKLARDYFENNRWKEVASHERLVVGSKKLDKKYGK